MKQPAATASLAIAQCPRCGAANGCALADGTPADRCWCITVPARLPMPDNTAPSACYCPRCLQAGSDAR